MINKLQKTNFSRQEFYDLVWLKPAKTLATELGISDVMIAKICKKHNIPKPGLGYWSRLANGYNDPVAKLLPINDPKLETIEFSPNSDNEKSKVQLSSEANALLLNETKPDRKVVIPKKIHPLLVEAKNTLLLDKYPQDGLVSSGRTGFKLKMSKENVNRGIGILGALVSAFEKRNFKFGPSESGFREKGSLSVTIFGEEISFRFRELLKRTCIKSLDEIKDRNIRQRHEFGFRAGGQILLPTGVLHLEIITYSDIPCQKSWSDKPNKPLENQLDDIVKGFILAAEGSRVHTNKMAERHREWKKQEDEAREKEENAKARRDRMEAIGKLSRAVQEHEQVKRLKMEIEELLKVNARADETVQLMKWIDEYLSVGNPVDQFLQKTIKPLLDNSISK